MTKTSTILVTLLCVMAAVPARAVKIADITRMYGQRSNVLEGISLVTGLKGTGDGGSYEPAMKPLAKLLTQFADPSTEKDLTNASNVAIVLVTAVLPKDGWHVGDKVDCYVTSLGAATSLRGGRLFQVPMKGPSIGAPGNLFAMAEGPVVLEDPTSPVTGVIKGGCVMDTEYHMPYVEDGRFKLILEDPAASWITASSISQIINQNEAPDSREILATTLDPKTVEVVVPAAEREHPDAFIARIQRLPIPERLLAGEARVQINERTHTLIITGDVEISPVVISHAGLTIQTVNPPPVPGPRNPLIRQRDAIPVDTTGTGGAKLQDLVNALDQLKVPAEDRITIIKELYKTGKLHAKLITE
jgi:flagellar P-ring protein precursor FlgI